MSFSRQQISVFLKKLRRDHIAAVLIFPGIMILWRLGLRAFSSRYWAAIWLPLLLLESRLLFCKPLGLRLSRILAAVLLLAYLGKDLHFNYNDNAIIHASNAIREDARQFPRVFVAISDHAKLFSQIKFYVNLPVLPSRAWRDFSVFYNSVRGLYDVCYYVTDDKVGEHEKTQKLLATVRAELIFSQFKDMHRKKKISVYRIKLPQQGKSLPVNGEIWPNGSFEKLYKKGDFFFPQNYAPCHTVNRNCSIKGIPDAVSGKYSFYCRSAGQTDVYSDLVPPPSADGTIVLSVKSKSKAILSLSIWKFNKKGEMLSREVILDAVLPDHAVQHQFQIPFSAKKYLDADVIRCYFSVQAPEGILLDDFGIYRAIP